MDFIDKIDASITIGKVKFPLMRISEKELEEYKLLDVRTFGIPKVIYFNAIDDFELWPPLSEDMSVYDVCYLTIVENEKEHRIYF